MSLRDRAHNAAMALLSIPLDRKTPTGTSLSKCDDAATLNTSRNFSSAPDRPPAGSAIVGKSQCRPVRENERASAFKSNAAHVPGGSALAPA